MKRILFCLLLLAALAAPAWAADESAPEKPERPLVRIETTEGDILIELWPDKAPKTVENFLAHVEYGHYEGTIFHRVVEDFVIQGGGFEPGLEFREPPFPPIENEARSDVRNTRGTVAMARTEDPHSARAQFFINLMNNAALDHRGEASGRWGYTVFGRVKRGMRTVESIHRLPTTTVRGMPDVPEEPPVITAVRVIESGQVN